MSASKEASPARRDKSRSVAKPQSERRKDSTEYEDGRITVSVRVRPLNTRESKLGVGSCIGALSTHSTLYIFPSSDTARNFDALVAQDPQLRGVTHHRFTFDHVYPTDATQEQVYEQIGHPVLQSSFSGYHTCIFAYGQTGSGKSYCMMGADGGRVIDEAPGVIPRLGSEMFAEMTTRRAQAMANNEQVEFRVYVSYLEIYRERVRSLLDEASDSKAIAADTSASPTGTAGPSAPARSTARRSAAPAHSSGPDATSGDGNLRVREHPTLGVYVEGLPEIAVTTVDQVLRLMVRGNHRRRTASTRMNDTSSRSHAIFTMQLLQTRTHTLPPGAAAEGQPSPTEKKATTEKKGGKKNTNASSPTSTATAAASPADGTAGEPAAVTAATTQLGAKINLVDLAGSERAKATGAEGDTLKEGAQINQSLTTLGIVINALAAQSTAVAAAAASSTSAGGATAAKRHIPYRDSTLTFLLKESLGGNSKTFMIATVSPSMDNYDESLSTLRYADRAKSIVMRAFVNETAGDKRIRELEEEVTHLREKIKALLDAEATRAASAIREEPSPSLVMPPPARATGGVTVVQSDSESSSVNPTGYDDAEEEEKGATQSSEEGKPPGGEPRAHANAADMEKRAESTDSNNDNNEGTSSSDVVAENASSRNADTTAAAAAAAAEAEAEAAGLYSTLLLSPQPDLTAEPREAVVETLQSELHRAEEMIRQMSITQAARDAHIAKLLQQHEAEKAAAQAAMAVAKEEAKRSATAAAVAAAVATPAAPPPEATSTVRLSRDEPYLLNMDGAGDWVLAHLGTARTLVGVLPRLLERAPENSAKRRTEAVAATTAAKAEDTGVPRSQSNASYDSSLSLPSSAKFEEPREENDSNDKDNDNNNDDAARTFEDSDEVHYVKLPRELSGGVGSPHCILERAAMSPTGTTNSVTLRGCGNYETYVLRPATSTPFLIKGADSTLVLESGDVLDMGTDHIQLKYMDPAAPPVTVRARRTVSFPVRPSDGLSAIDFPGKDTAGNPKRQLRSPTEMRPDGNGEKDDDDDAAGRATASPSPMRYDPQLLNGAPEERVEATTSPIVEQTVEDGASPRDTAENPTHSDRDDASDDDSPTRSATPPAFPPRPLIPSLALGKALSTASFPAGQDAPSHSSSSTEDHLASTTATSEDTETHSPFSLTSANGDFNSNADSTGKSLSFAEDAATVATASQRSIFKSRIPSKQRTDASNTVHLEPNATLTATELQAMRNVAAASTTLRSELPARFVGRYNLVLLGPSGGGKTSLVDNLSKPDTPWLRSAFSALRSGESTRESIYATVGIQVRTLMDPGPVPMTLQTHELGGTPCFSPLMDQLPLHRVTYLLCFPLHGLTSLMTLRGIVEDILCRTDSHTVSLVLVGTHADRDATGKEDGSFFSRLSLARQKDLHRQLEEIEEQVVSLIQMLQPYAQLRPTIVGRFAIDNVHRHVYTTGFKSVDGFPQWLQWLCDLARDRCKADADFANGLVPARCMELGRQVGLLRSHGKWCISLRDFKTLANVVSAQYTLSSPANAEVSSPVSPTFVLPERDSLRHHVQLLTDWGLLMHRFRSDPLRQHVILDVAWLSRLLAALACCPLVAAAESDGLKHDEAAALVDVVGEQGTVSLTRKESALRVLLTPVAERVVDMVKVATTDTPHLLQYGVLSLPVLIAVVEPHFKAMTDAPSGAPPILVGRTVENIGDGVRSVVSKLPDARTRDSDNNKKTSKGDVVFPTATALVHGSPNTNARYAVPLAGVVELLVLLDMIIVGHKLLLSSPSDLQHESTPSSLQSSMRRRTSVHGHDADTGKEGEHSRSEMEEEKETGDAADVEKESFVLYPFSFRTPASAGVTWVFPCFLSGPFYMFKLDMVPRNFFPKLLCRLATLSDKIYFGPVKERVWGSSTQRWSKDSPKTRSGASSAAAGASSGPFASYFARRTDPAFTLPSFATYFTGTSSDGRPRRRDGFWCDAAWLVYTGDGDDNKSSDAAAEGRDECRVLVRLVHHSVFLSFHCHGVAAPASSTSFLCGSGRRGIPVDSQNGAASPGVQDFYEAVLEAVRHVVEEFPGGRCVETLQCCVDTATLLQAEMQHPAEKSDHEAASLDRYVRYTNVTANINNLERVLSKSGTALRTARTARRPHRTTTTTSDVRNSEDTRGAVESQKQEEETYVPLLRHFTQIPPLAVHECIRRWKSEQRLYIAPDVEAALSSALEELEACYHNPGADTSVDSCVKLDRLLDVLARIDTA